MRKLFIIGPNRPCESSVKGSRIMLLLRRSPMLSSPRIVSDGSTLLYLFLRRNFFRSSSRRCESAWADIVVTSSGEFDGRNGCVGLHAPAQGHCSESSLRFFEVPQNQCAM